MSSVSAARASLLRAAAARSAVAQNARMAPRYAAPSSTPAVRHGRRQASHAVDAHAQASQIEYPPEDFRGPFWRNTALALLFTFALYQVSARYAPGAQPAALHENHDPEAKPIEAGDESKPYLTRYIAYHMPRQNLWKERNDKHLEMTLVVAEDKLLVQDAQRPKIRRLRNASSFEQASPHGIPVGGTVDMSDLNVKS